MTEYILYATSSANPIQNANITFMATIDPAPFIQYFSYGLVVGITTASVLYFITSLLEKKWYNKS